MLTATLCTQERAIKAGCSRLTLRWQGSIDNPFNPLFALFIALWSILLNAGWERLESTMQYEWGTTDFEKPQADRTEFVQNKRT